MTLACDIKDMLACFDELKEILGDPLEIDWSTFPQGIEVSAMDSGCIVDADGNVVGKLAACKIVDEETEATTFKLVGLRATGVEDPFVLAAGETIDFTCGGAAGQATQEEMLEKLCKILEALECPDAAACEVTFGDGGTTVVSCLLGGAPGDTVTFCDAAGNEIGTGTIDGYGESTGPDSTKFSTTEGTNGVVGGTAKLA